MSKEEVISRSREWWDEHAADSATIEDVVGRSSHVWEPATKELINSKIAGMLSRAHGRDLCLDIACGVGLYFPLIRSIFKRVVGVDFSPGVLGRMPEKSRRVPGVAACAGSVFELPLTENAADAIFFRDTLQCLPANLIPLAMAELHRVVNPGGVAVVHFKNSETLLSHLGAIKHNLLSGGGYSRRQRLQWELLPEREEVEPGKLQLWARPWQWYCRLAQDAGFQIQGRFSWQLFYRGRLEARGLTRRVERIERAARRMPLLNTLISHDGIEYYALFRKPFIRR